MKKNIALGVALCFLFQETGMAQTPQLFIPSAHSPEMIREQLPPVGIPASLGTLDEVWLPQGVAELPAKSILFVQDPHGIQEAQRNIESALSFLQQSKGIQHIFIEGGVGELSPERLRFFEDEGMNQKAAEFLLQEAEIGGPELFLLSQRGSSGSEAGKPEALGLEAQELYISNLKSFESVMRSRANSETLLEKHRVEIEREGSRSMNAELYRFFMEWVDSERGVSSLEQDLSNLEKKSRDVLGKKWGAPDLQLEWPMLVRFFEIMRRKALVQEEAASEEASRLSNWIEKNKIGQEVREMMALLSSKSDGGRQFERRKIWEDFYQQASQKGFRFEDYPQLMLREGARILEEEIDVLQLFKEKELLRSQILEKLQKKSAEKEVLEAFRDYLLLKKMLTLELSHEEYLYYRQRFNQKRKIPTELRPLAEQAEQFYALALKRDNTMADSIISRLAGVKADDGITVVIAGGFHRKGMTDAFRKKGLPYAVFSPHFSDFSGKEKYEESMTGKTGPFDLSHFQIRTAQWMNDWQNSLPAAVMARRGAMERAILQRGIDLGAVPRSGKRLLEAAGAPRSELRAVKPYKDLASVYDDIDSITGLKKTPGRKKQDPAIEVFLKFVRNENELRQFLQTESDAASIRIIFSALTDWLDGNLSKLLPILEEKGDKNTLGRLLEFSRRNMESPYADRLIEEALRRAELAESERRREARKQTAGKTAAPLRPQPKRFSARPKSDSVRPFASADERTELLRALRAVELPSVDPEKTRLKISLSPDFFKGANPWLPMAQDSVKLSFPKSLEGKTVILEEDDLPGDNGLRQIRLYENEIQDKNYLFSFIESETLGFSRSNDSFFVSSDYTFTNPQFPGETFWVLTTQNFDVENPQNKFRVITDAKGNLLKVIDASATAHPIYEVYDEAGEKRKGFFVMRMDGLWSPAEDFRGIVKGFLLGREKSQRGSEHDTAYVRIPGKNIYVAPGTAGLKKADVVMEGRKPVSVKVGEVTYDLILKRNESGTLVDVAREGFYDKIGSFTGTITRFKADSYGRASLGAPITGVQVADASKDGVWMSAALENGVLIRTDEWKNLPPAAPYVFEMEKPAEGVEAPKAEPRVLSIRLAEGKSRPKTTHDFLVLRDFQGKPRDSYKLRIPSETFEKHAGQVTGFTVHARGENLGRLQIKGKDYQLPGEYRDHPVTLLHFPEEKKLIFIVHSKTRTQVKDAYIYEMEGGEYKGSNRDASSLEKELKAKYQYPFDLSRVWREKIRSEETYEAARVAFEHGDLNAAEQLLHGVSLKARRHYRLAQQLLNSWIPKRRRLLASGPERNQRRLLRSFEKAAEQDQREPEEKESPEARSELRSNRSSEALRFREAESLREQDAQAALSPRWMRVGEEPLKVFSERRAEIEAQSPHPELAGTLLAALQRAYEERSVPFALERWITDAYENTLRRIREKEFEIYLFDWINRGQNGQVAAYYDDKANRLFLSREILEVLKQNDGGGRSLREGLLFEMLFPPRKVAVLGASGMVGREVYDLLRRVYPQVLGTAFSSEDEDLLKLDVTREADVEAFLKQEKPDVVVYAAGVAGVEEAENNKPLAELLNVTVPERISKTFPGQFIYFSTDYVFDGTQAPYKPKAETKPLNYYGETKVRGERSVLNKSGNTVIRLGWVYGSKSAESRDPFHRAIQWLEGRNENQLILDDKQVRHPIWAGDVAGVTLQSINNHRGGIVQLNGAEDLTRYRFTEAVWEAYLNLYPAWLEPPGHHLTSTQMWQWRENEEAADKAAAAARPQDAKMRNTVRPTRLEDVLRYLIPMYSVPDEVFYQKLYAALETGNSEEIQKISRALESRNIRWAFVGQPQDVPGAAENGVKIWNDSQREELYTELIQDTKVKPSNEIRIRRALDAMLMGIPEKQKGIVFLKPMIMGDEPNVELSLFPSFAGSKSMLYLLSYGYMEASSMGRVSRFWIPTERESGGEIDETVKTELAGGSYSQIERILNPDGTTVIEKRAKTSEDKGKLLAEARYMQALQKSADPAGRWFPEIFSIEEKDGWSIVRMQDLAWPSLSNMIMNAFPAGDDIFGQMMGRAYEGNQSLLEAIKYIYKTLTPDFYAHQQSSTPEDFAEKYHFQKLEQRWREAGEKSSWMKELLAAPYLEFEGEREPLSLNLPLMLRVLRRINQLHPELFKPPYLAKQHGDLHAGNILVDPFDSLKTGKIGNFKLIDPKYIPEGNDPVYDFAKLIHNYFGHYDLALDHHQTFHFNVNFSDSGKGPAVFSNYFDDEASGTLMMLGRIDQFSKDFMRFIMDPKSDELFPFEPDPVAWRKRLLFTHASLMAGLLPFHVVGDGWEHKASVIYARSAQLMSSFLEAIAVSDELGDSPDAWQLRLRLNEVEIAKAGNNKKAFQEAVARLEQYLDLLEQSGNAEASAESAQQETPPGAGGRSELRSDQAPWVRDTDQTVTIAKAKRAGDLLAFTESDAVIDLLMQTLFQIRLIPERPKTEGRRKKAQPQGTPWDIENPAALVVDRVYQFWHQGRKFGSPQELTAFFEPLEVLAKRDDGVAPFLVRGLQAKLLMMAGFREEAEKEVLEGWPKYDQENFAFALARGDTQAALSPYTAIGLQHLFAAMHKDLQMVKYEAGPRKDNDFDSFVTLVRSYHYWREARSRWDSSAAHYQEASQKSSAAVSRARRAAVYAEERIHLLEEKYSQELGLAEIPEELTAKQELEVVFNSYRLALAVITPTFQYHVFNRLLKPVLETLALDKSKGMQARTLLRAKKAAEGLAAIAEHSRTHTMGDVTIYEDVLEILATAQVHTDRTLRKLGKSQEPSALSPFAARLDGLIELMDREIARGYTERQRSVEIYYPKLLEAVVVFEKILRTAKKNSLKGRDLVDLLHKARILKSFFGKEPDSVYDNHKTFLDSLKEKGYEAEALSQGLESLEHYLLEETRFNLPRSELRHPFGEPAFDVQSSLWRREGPVTPFPGVTLEMIERAQKILKHFWSGIGEVGENDIREGKFQIPLVHNEMLDQAMKNLTGRSNKYYLYYLPELPEGSFKPYLAADLLTRYFESPEKLAQLEMVVAESTGNQGKAVASLVQKLKKHPYYAPYAQQLSAVIFVPRGANPEKIKAMKDLGAVVVNRKFSEDELRVYAKADEAGRAHIEAQSSAPYFEEYKDASQYVDQYAKTHPDTAHYIRHGSAMGVAAYAVIMLEALDQWFRLQGEAVEGKTPVSSADFQDFIKFVGNETEFSKVRFWVPGGSAGLGSGVAQVKLIRPDVQVFLTQVPGVDHIFKSLKAGQLIPKDQAVFNPDALRFVDGIAATGEPTTYEIVRGMADAVMLVPHQDNNRMARLILSLGLGYVGTLGVKRYLESELSPFLPLTNAVYSRKFEKALPALTEEGKHIIVPVTGRTTDWQLDAEIRDLDLSEAINRLKTAAAPEREIPELFRSELRTEKEGDKSSASLDFEEHQRLRAIAKQIDEGDYDAARSLINAYRMESPDKLLIQQNLNFFEARMLGDAARFDEAEAILEAIELQTPAFKDAGSTRPISAQKSIFGLFKKYKARLEGQGYEFVKKLGAGTFGDAYLFRNVSTDQKVVLKVIGGTSLDITDAIDKMSTQGQLSVEIDVNDSFFSKVGDAPEKAAIPRNLEVFEEENELGISMPEAIVMTFVEGKTLPGFLQGAEDAVIQRFQEQFPEKWLGLIESLKEGGYVYIDYRPDNFFFSWDENQNLVIKSVDRGIIMKFKKPEAGSDSDPRELAVLGAAAMFKVFSGKEPDLEYRNRLRAALELGPEQEAYLAASLRPGDEANMQAYQALLEKLGLELKSRDGQIGYRPDYEMPPLKFNLVLIPHGETDANKRGVFHGHSDSKDENLLNEDGKRQVVEGASKLAEWIQQQGLKTEDLVFLRSPLRRTEQTSELSLAEAGKTVPGLPAKAEVEPDSIEIDFAEWDGKDAAEIEAERGAEEKKFMEAYRNLNALMKAPSGENFLTLLDRARELLLKLNEKYAGKTVVLYGHGTMAAAMRILFQSPEVHVANYLNWRNEAVPPRGEPTVFMARSELRLTSPSEEDRNLREKQLAVAVQMTAGILPVAFAAEGLAGVMTLMPSFVQSTAPLRLGMQEKTAMARVFSNLIAQGGKAVLPARIFQAVSPRVRELFVELFVQGAVHVPSQPVVYIAGEGASDIKESFFAYGIFQKNPQAQHLFEIRAQEEAVMANRLKQESVAVSLAKPPDEEALDAAIPAFLLNAEEIRKLGEEDQARLLVRMTQLQLLAAVELKGQLEPAKQGMLLADFLRKAGITASTGPQGYIVPSVQSLLSETVGTYLAAYQATAKAA